MFARASADEILTPAHTHGASRESAMSSSRTTQEAWAGTAIDARLKVLRRARTLLATNTGKLTEAVSATLPRTAADTLVAEVLPLLAACRFLERSAAGILRTRTLGAIGRPAWLPGLHATIERVPLGTILVIGPANYPLFLPGVQTLQALAAGNSVLWKPGSGGRSVALVVADTLAAAGLPAGLLTILHEDASAATEAITHGVDKVVLTGSATTGRAVLHQAADQLTPVVAELSGADALIVLPGADLEAVADAVAFSLRFNGSATCMAPRRVLLVDASTATRDQLLGLLRARLAPLPPVPLTAATVAALRPLLDAAQTAGAQLLTGGWAGDDALLPTVLTGANTTMELAGADIFAPVLSIIDVIGEEGVLAAQRACPLALTAAIFGEPRQAQQLARALKVGTVLINDVIVATADPRLPFGGRKRSGFGSTRGAEGLLEMTAPRVIATQQDRDRRRFEQTSALHIGLFTGVAALLYAGSLKDRWGGLRTLTAAGRALTTSRRQADNA